MLYVMGKRVSCSKVPTKRSNFCIAWSTMRCYVQRLRAMRGEKYANALVKTVFSIDLLSLYAVPQTLTVTA